MVHPLKKLYGGNLLNLRLFSIDALSYNDSFHLEQLSNGIAKLSLSEKWYGARCTRRTGRYATPVVTVFFYSHTFDISTHFFNVIIIIVYKSTYS